MNGLFLITSTSVLAGVELEGAGVEAVVVAFFFHIDLHQFTRYVFGG